MNDQTNTAGEAGTPEKEKAAPKEIIRGRMPVAVVALARFGSMKDQATKALADAFGTTVGKIDDIKKNRNFAYVTAEFKPTAAQKADGVEWLKRHPTGAQALIDELQATPEATPEEAAAFEQVRSSARGQSEKTKSGEAADAGGGNRRGKGKGKKDDAAPAADAAKTGESLLS